MSSRHTVKHAYRANHDGTQLGPWVAGDEVELDADVAAWVNIDSPGALAEVKAERQGEAKPNRQGRTPRNRGA